MISTGGLLVLLNGMMGTSGNRWITAGFTLLPLFGLCALGRRRSFCVNAIDALFLIFAGCIGLSILENGSRDASAVFFLASTLLSYPACRFIRLGKSRSYFLIVTGAVVAAGSIATAIALVSQWDRLDHPSVFGFSHAATVFLSSVGFLLIYYACVKADWKTALWLAFPLAIFAASMVRFVFVAIVAGLIAAAVTSPDRKRVLGIVAMLCISAAIGFAAHYKASKLQLVQNVFQLYAPTQSTGGTGNSLTIRRDLLRNGIAALPTAGLFGHGLAWSEGTHNSFLEAAIEFGWSGGIALIFLFATAIWRLWPLAFEIEEARFVLSSLIYLAGISLVYGSISHEQLLFLFLGYAARLNEEFSSPRGSKGAAFLSKAEGTDTLAFGLVGSSPDKCAIRTAAPRNSTPSNKT
jgi:hypothetical protein